MQITRYRQRLSGPLVDRSDLPVEVPNVGCKHMSSNAPGEASETLQYRVSAARLIAIVPIPFPTAT